MKENKVRITISIDEENLKILDILVKYEGVNRSLYLNKYLAQLRQIYMKNNSLPVIIGKGIKDLTDSMKDIEINENKEVLLNE